MDYRYLGRSALQVSPLCLGAMMFGGETDVATSQRIITKAGEQGINFIDTADVYPAWVPGNRGGESETSIGRWLQRSGKRDKVVIASTPAAAVSSASTVSDNVDAAVTALVAQSSSAAPTAPAGPALQDEYKGKIEELSKANGQLESQVSKLTQDVAELKTLLEAKVAAPAEPAFSRAWYPASS